MDEYLIYVGKGTENVPDDWEEQIRAHRGVSCNVTSINGIVIKCNEETEEKLRKAFPYLKIEFIVPHYRDQKNEK